VKLIKEPISNRNGILYIDGVSTLELAKRYDTPLFVTSEERIKQNYQRLYQALISRYKKIRIYYAAKANSNLSILRILHKEGSYIDAVSPGEIWLAQRAGFSSNRILFTGTSVRNEELTTALSSKITINIDSLSELRRLLQISIPEMISVRINPEIGAGHHDHVITAGPNTKFGLWEENAIKAYEQAKIAGIRKFGIQMHVGSGVLDTSPFLMALEKILEIAKKIKNKLDISFEFIDIGGGLGVPYKPTDKTLDLDLFSSKVLSIFKKRIEEYNLGSPYFCMEPGRYLVSDSTLLLTKVNTVKVTPFKRFVGIDAGFNTLIRPTMYGSYHHLLVANKMNTPEKKVYDIVGPICETGDILAKDRFLPLIDEDDLLAFLNAGAYGFAMSSQYNSRPRAAEVLIRAGKPLLIRTRENTNSLILNQEIPE
jgi:diaminopimelate decarboxylase